MPAFILAIVFFFSSLAFAQSERWWEAGNERVKIFYRAGDDANVEALNRFAAATLPTLEDQLQTSLLTPAHIYLASSQDEFNRLTGGRLPEWSQGVSFPEQNAIVLKSPRFSKGTEEFHRTTAHELTHLLIGVKTGGRVPRWFNEGLALWLSGEGQGKALMPLSRAVWSGSLIPLERIEQVDTFQQTEAELAYLQSYHLTEFLIKRYGWETIRRILNDIGAGSSWDESLFRETELDQAGLEAEWHTELKKSYRWMILLDAEFFVFLGMTVLVLIAGVLVIRRRRKIYRQWSAEEETQTGIF
jgi:hypothetical protein